MKRKQRKGERKLTRIVDGDGRQTAENLMNTQLSELLDDLAEVIGDAVRRNPDNPNVALTIDKRSQRKAQKILKQLQDMFEPSSNVGKAAKSRARRRTARSVNRLDICYLASVANLSARFSERLSGLIRSVENGVRSPWTNESAIGKGTNRRYVDSTKHLTKTEQLHLRNMAKTMQGRSLRVNVLNVVEERLDKFGIGGSEAVREAFGSNAVRLPNAIHSSLRKGVNAAVEALAANPAIGADSLHNVVYREIAPDFGVARNSMKIAARSVVSSSLNLAIVEQIEQLVGNGLIANTDFFLNMPGFLYKAVMDMRTSDICRSLNGLIIPLSDRSRLMKYMPPQHPNCRSILVPNLRV